MTDTCGPTFYAPLGKWDRDSQSWKTSEATSLWALTLSSLTLPTWGGLHGGELFKHPTPELRISGRDYSSLPTPRASVSDEDPQTFLERRDRVQAKEGRTGGPTGMPLGVAVATLPTPTTDDAGNLTRDSGAFQSLTRSVQMLPTPTTQHASGGYNPAWGHGMTLLDAAKVIVGAPAGPTTLLPTPAVNDMGEGKTLEWWDEWAPRQMSSDGRPAPHGKSLAIEAMRMLPTPSAADGMGGHLTRSGDRSDEMLLPGLAVALCNGATTAPPSPDGSASSDDPHQPQLSLDVQGIPA